MVRLLLLVAFLSSPLLSIDAAQAEWKALGSLNRPLFSRVNLQCSQRLAIDGIKIAFTTTTSNRNYAVESSGDASERAYFFSIGENFTLNSSMPSPTTIVLDSLGVIPQNQSDAAGQLLGYQLTVQVSARSGNQIHISADVRDEAQENGVTSVGSQASNAALKRVVLEQNCS